MSRKAKANKLFGDQVGEAQPEEMPTKALSIDENAVVGSGRMSTADAEKLQKYDAMEKSLASVSQEKEMLESKIIEYIDQINSFKDSANEIKSLKDELEEYKSKCDNYEKSQSYVHELEAKVAQLENENDQYLIKISELTFENAQLTSQLSMHDHAEKKNGVVYNQQQFMPARGVQQQCGGNMAKPHVDAYNPYLNNGYGTW